MSFALGFLCAVIIFFPFAIHDYISNYKAIKIMCNITKVEIPKYPITNSPIETVWMISPEKDRDGNATNQTYIVEKALFWNGKELHTSGLYECRYCTSSEIPLDYCYSWHK